MSSANSTACAAIAQWRRAWRRDHPFGFVALPTANADDSINLFAWKISIPGRLGTDWAGGSYAGRLEFANEFPVQPPVFTFTPPLFHPNVYPNGQVCITTLAADWCADLTLADVLLSIQALLENPNPSSPAQLEAVLLFTEDRETYVKRVKAMALQFANENAFAEANEGFV